MKIYIKSLVVLTAICGIIAILLSAANFITEPIIKKNAEAAANEALMVVLPDGGDFEAVDLKAYTLPETVQKAYKASNGGYVVELNVNGYKPGMIIMCGIDADIKIVNAVCLSSNETNGAEKTYGEKAKGATVDTVGDLDVVSSSTLTSNGYKTALKDALNTATVLGGGTADLRTEEEILQDHLNAALPAAEGKFVSLPLVQISESVSAIYLAENNSGAVCVSGEQFVPLSMEGKVLSDKVDATLTAKIEEQAKKVLTMEKIDLSGYAELPDQLKNAYQMADGNYLLEMAANGFGIYGDSEKYIQPNNVPIMILVEATPDGTIQNCRTLSHQESAGYGAACGEESFYAQFNGKDENNYKEIDGINGATITTKGYMTAIGKVFEVVEILKGES